MGGAASWLPITRRTRNWELGTGSWELGMLGLHSVQNCLVYINTLMIRQILGEPGWLERMKPEDLRAMTPLTYRHVNPCGTLQLNMEECLQLEQQAA